MPQWLAYIIFFVSFLALLSTSLLWVIAVISPRTGNKLLRRKFFVRRRGAFVKVGAIVLVLLIGTGALGANAAGPVVTLNNLKDNRASTDSDHFDLSGDVADKMAKLQVNGAKVAVDASGHFSYTVQLSEGDNAFRFVAVNQRGDRTNDAQAVVHRTTQAELAARVKARTHSSQPTASVTPSPSASPEPPPQVLGPRTKSTGCHINGALPDKDCTPGAFFAGVTAAQVCVSGYSSSVRNVSETTKNAVYAEYGIGTHASGEYEVDHLIALELGGSNDISNLWPEPANPAPGFHQKDTLENSFHAQVCSGQMTLAQAQTEMAGNWLAADGSSVAAAPTVRPATPPPAAAPAPAQTDIGGGFIKMSTTNICHAPGDAYYDRTIHYTAYPSMDACIAAGGRPSER